MENMHFGIPKSGSQPGRKCQSLREILLILGGGFIMGGGLFPSIVIYTYIWGLRGLPRALIVPRVCSAIGVARASSEPPLRRVEAAADAKVSQFGSIASPV